MTSNVWISVGLGAGIGLLYGAAAVLTARWAARFHDRRFMLVFFGGMIVRLTGAAAAVTLVLLLLPVRELAFIGAFLAAFMIGTVLEVWMVHRGRMTHRPEE